MPTSRNLVLLQGNDEQIDLSVTSGGTAYDLTGATVTVYIKASETTPDASATATLTTGDGVTEIDYAKGAVRATIPSTATATAGGYWWRADVSKSGAVRTAAYGVLTVMAV